MWCVHTMEYYSAFKKRNFHGKINPHLMTASLFCLLGQQDSGKTSGRERQEIKV